MELREKSPLREPTLSYVFEGKIGTSENLESGLVVAHADTVTGFFSLWTYAEHCFLLTGLGCSNCSFLFSYGITLYSPGWRHT